MANFGTIRPLLFLLKYIDYIFQMDNEYFILRIINNYLPKFIEVHLDATCKHAPSDQPFRKGRN